MVRVEPVMPPGHAGNEPPFAVTRMSQPPEPPQPTWPEQVEALFEDGPVAGMLLPVPARDGAPPLMVGVLLDEAGTVSEIRAGNLDSKRPVPTTGLLDTTYRGRSCRRRAPASPALS